MTLNNPPRLAILPDFPEEGWPSMDLAAEMLTRELRALPGWADRVTQIRPQYHRLAGVRNLDRLLNRMVHYPRYAARIAKDFDAFHIVDHSYSQLVHRLPHERSGVFCHDLDTFRCIIQPAADPRPRWFRAMARHILDGFQKAAVVFYATETVRREIESHSLVDSSRLMHAPLGVAPEFSAAAIEVPPDLAPAVATRFMLHVGSCVPRKRVDVAIELLARLRAELAKDLRLVKVGGEFSPENEQQIDRLGVRSSIVHLSSIDRTRLASLYRAAAVVVQPSEAEGFGLPVIEALACGAAVIASDIPVLREVGGNAATYCAVGDLQQWTAAATRALLEPQSLPNREQRLAQAAKFSWRRHAEIIADAYRRLI